MPFHFFDWLCLVGIILALVMFADFHYFEQHYDSRRLVAPPIQEVDRMVRLASARDKLAAKNKAEFERRMGINTTNSSSVDPDDDEDEELDANDPYTKMLRDHKADIIKNGVFRPMNEAIPKLIEKARSQSRKQRNINAYSIVTIGASNYKEVVLNWMSHLDALGVKEYIVLCVDSQIFDDVGHEHGILIEYNVNATLKKYTRKKRTTKAHSEIFTQSDKDVLAMLQAPVFTRSRTKTSSSQNVDTSPTRKSKFSIFSRFLQATSTQPSYKTSKYNRTNIMKARNARTKLNRTATKTKYNVTRVVKRNATRKNYTEILRKYREANYTSKRSYNFDESVMWSSTYRKSDSTSASTNYRSTRWIFDKQKAFSIMMYIKHSSILALLTAGYSVVWSDVDCIWIKICAVNFLNTFVSPQNDHRRLKLRGIGGPLVGVQKSITDIRIVHELEKLTQSRVDIATQQGSSPFGTSDIIGTAICTGFFVVNPTPASLVLISSVQQSMITTIDETCGKNCSVGDQSVMNELITDYGDLSGWATKNPKILYGPSHVTFNPMEKTQFLNTNLTIPRNLVGESQRHHASNLATNIPIVIGFLPYDLFPRGDARVNVTALELRIEALRKRTNSSRVYTRAPTVKKNKLMSAGQAKMKNANEWADLKDNACIWHMYSKKDGKTKVLAMFRDGVYLRSKFDEEEEGK